MSHGEAWHFCRLGPAARARRQDVAHPRREVLPAAARASTTSARRSTTSSGRRCCARRARFEMYRKRHGRITPATVVEFLLLDREFPRAIRFCLIEARGVAARDHRHAAGHVPQRRPSSAWAAALGAGLRAGRRHHRRAACTSTRRAAEAAEPRRQRHPRDVLRAPAPHAAGAAKGQAQAGLTPGRVTRAPPARARTAACRSRGDSTNG